MSDRDVDVPRSKGIELGFRSEHRLHAASEFSLVFAARRVVRGKKFDLHYRCRESTPPTQPAGARLGLVIPKKLARRAVLRNLLKRLAREVFRHVRQCLPAYDLVLRLARSPGDRLDADARKLMRADLEDLLVRLPQCASC